jgi:hypothetical protein
MYGDFYPNYVYIHDQLDSCAFVWELCLQQDSSSVYQQWIHSCAFIWEFVRSIQEQRVKGDAVKFVCCEAKQMC